MDEELESTILDDAVESFIAAASAIGAYTSAPIDNTTQSEVPQAEADVWSRRDDEDGWMPKPARLHSGRTRCCAVCFAPLQYTPAASWDEYLQSEEYLDQLQANILQDAFISSLICGGNTAGDLPTEHRMHKNRKLKCRQSVTDYINMTSAGVMDTSGMEKGSVRTLEEMLVEALPTPVYTHVLERRLAVISHSVKIVRELMSHGRTKKIPRPEERAPGNEELHHLAIHTLSALLGTFDYKNPQALRPFEELSQLLTCFPVLSLYTFWSPMKKPPDTVLTLDKKAVEASSVATGSDAHESQCAVDGADNSYWESESNPGIVYFSVRTTELAKVTSISLQWRTKCVPKTVGLQYRLEGSEHFVQVVEDHTVSLSGPTVIEAHFPVRCREARIVMAGALPLSGHGTYAIEHLRLGMPAPSSLFADPVVTIGTVADWLLGALDIVDEVMIAEALGALRAWALSTASLHVTLLFADMLLQLHGDEKKPLWSQIVTLASEQGHLLRKSINAYSREKAQRLAHEEVKLDSDDACRVDAFFEPLVSSAGVVIEQEGLVVRTRETRYQYAAVNCGISTGKASWRFRLDADTQDDEMTCFGAAILPVTVNGYDSSPSLWMLRGYNGNLYARGHKLSRTIGKVHPGNIVQVDIDMSEGTLAYKINSTDYGVVFTDLAGHKVYPAVSFYGSGKVVTLLEVTKWDYSTDSANANPVFLSSVTEYQYSVGYGTLGKGSRLGCSNSGDLNTSPDNDTPTSRSTLVYINGEAKQSCLSTCPPLHGDAYVIYDLSEAYHMISGAVAINDDTHDEDYHGHRVALVYEIFGDAKLLWQSKPLSESFRIEHFEVSVKNVRMLELKVSCPGSNYHAHAVWVDPCLHPVTEWVCSECYSANSGSAKVCMVCMNGSRNQGSNVADDVTIEGISKGPMPLASIKDGRVAHDLESLSELGTIIIEQIYNLCQYDSKPVASVKSFIEFEEPFCRQPSKDVFFLLLVILRRYHGSFIHCGVDARLSGGAKLAHDGCVYILGIICANLESITCYDVKDPAAELGVSTDLITGLRVELEEMARLRGGPQTLTDDIEKAAAQTIVTGMPVLYPSPIGKLELLLQLLQLYVSRATDVTPACCFVLTSVMELLATSGPDGILTFMPFMAAQVAKWRGSRVKEIDKAAWTSAVTETIKIIMQVAVNAQEKQFAADTRLSSTEAGLSRDRLPDIAIRLLRTYQLCLLSEAVELTKDTMIESTSTNIRDVNDSTATLERRSQVQETNIQFGLLSLNSYTDLISSIVSLQAEESFLLPRMAAVRRAGVRSYKIPLLSDVLPWFVASLCLMRRQTWLARQILPAVVRLLEVLDHFCSESQAVTKSAHRFRELEIYKKARLIETHETERAITLEKSSSCRSHNTKRLYNVFRQLYTGEKDHFEGQIGFQFEAVSSFTVAALGRSVNPIRHGGRLIREHTIRLWEEESQHLIAQVLIGGSSKKDAYGYAFEILSHPAKVIQGKLYRLTTHEFANGGDPWYKRENILDEEYDKSCIKILRDCYASGSAGFPGSQNMIGAAYGVPTFMVQDEVPLASLPRFVPPHGCLSLQFDPKNKLNSICISHTGTSAYVKDDNINMWRTCLLRTAFLHGVHSVDFTLKCLRAGGTASGHICIGINWQQAHEKRHIKSPHSAFEMFIGKTPTSMGWMPSIGSVWISGARYDYGPKLSVAVGDIFTLIVDYDLQLLSFAYNGRKLGVAVGPKEFKPLGTAIEEFPKIVFAGVSLYGSQDAVQVSPSGIAESSLQIHCLFDLHNSLASLAGRIASTLVAGHPVDEMEEELLPWLQSSLLSGGIAESEAMQDQPCKAGSLLWSDALQVECARYTAKDRTSESGVLTDFPPHTLSNVNRDSFSRNRSSGGHTQSSEGQHVSLFWKNWTSDMTENGNVQVIMSWLEKHSPDSTLLSRLGRFPSCERWMFAALVMHAPTHVLQEVQAIAVGAVASTDGNIVGADPFGAYTDLAPSDDLICVWKRIMMLRHWLIKVRQGYRAKEADESLLFEPDFPEEKSQEIVVERSDDAALLKRFSGKANLERSTVVPKTFDEHLQQMIQRAGFLCRLAPPSEEAERLKGDSHVALFKLAEKWSAQTIFPSLQPVLERWKVLGEADSSKWSGIVDILRAQHRWRARRASTQSPVSAKAAGAGPQIITNDVTMDIDGSGDLSETKKYHYTNSFSAMMKACELYIRDGTGAPPEALTSLLDRRQRRSDSRLFGLQAMKSILSTLSFDSAIHNAIIFLRPAMRGFTESEKESRELNDGQVIAETFRATVRHHYLKGLEGCNRQVIEKVQDAFRELYTHLVQLLGSNSGYSVSDPQVKQSILCSWCLDFEAQDHQFLLDTGILLKLQEIFSISSVLREVVDDNSYVSGDTSLSRTSLDGYSSMNWHPLSEKFVQHGLVRSGYVTKRDVIRLLRRAPRYACPTEWWQKNDLESANDVISTAARHTASSLSLLYADMLAKLQRKLQGPALGAPISKVLQFGDKVALATTHGGQVSATSKSDEVSYVEMPALGEVKDFTIEMWIFPTELVAIQALRCDNGVQTGSVYLELFGRHLQVSIPGNVPREQLFKSYQFETFVWTHCAVTYDAENKHLQLFVNGDLSERMEYGRVCNSVNFRPSRLGCWMSSVETQGAALANASSQREFKGSIAEVRIWRISRTRQEIQLDFQRSIPLARRSNEAFEVKPQAPSNDMIGLWHLTEGEGICSFDCSPVREAQAFDAILHCRSVPAIITLPVFASNKIDDMSLDEWSCTVMRIRSFQRKIRSWLTVQFHESVRIAKLVCEHEEQTAIKRWNQLSRIDGDSGDVEASDNDTNCVGQQCSATTSSLLSQWAACTDEQIIIQKHTRKCAWIVFRFVASTGISGVFDRREEEAQAVAAAAKMKRKQRLQKSSGLGNVASSAVNGLLSTEASHASRLGVPDENAATRTAEVASEAAKSAATNRELEEPVLQTLWFSKEFHRKVFEALEKELIQGKELTEEAEGLTRAQRMLRSASTPVEKRGASIRQYPSDVARDKSGFVDVHHACPNDLSGNSERLESLEVEMHTFGVLLFMLSQSQESSTITYLVRPPMLRGLLEMLRLASPRSQRVVKLLLRRMCCSGNVRPDDVGAILGSDSVLLDLLLDQVAESRIALRSEVWTKTTRWHYLSH
uniref:B30.2/SPRY domain-containing protein n=1 Tax=Hyaloperonospora arabidopsidis (strain Emoy2) TaxID=559515 RepID=M4C5B7_HYAAE